LEERCECEGGSNLYHWCGWIDVVGMGMEIHGHCMGSTRLNDSVMDGIKIRTAYKEIEHF